MTDNKNTAKLELIPVHDPQQIEEVARLADTIWREYYFPLLGKAQVDYMLENLQSQEKMIEDITLNQMEYYLIEAENEKIGYLGIQWQEEVLFISKLYLLKQMRGQGYARRLLEMLAEWAKKRQKSGMQLTVNKDNAGSIRFYETFGFVRIDSVVSPIGGGFVMDDYIYLFPLRQLK